MSRFVAIMLRLFVPLVLPLLLNQSVYASANSVPAVQNKPALAQLVSALNKIQTLSATFVQYSLDQRGTRIQESKGELKADRAGRFYWRTYEPLEQVVISDGERVTVYDPDLEQATIQKLGAHVQSTPAILFSGDTSKIGDAYNVSVTVLEPGLRQFSLTPKATESLFDRLKLRFTNQRVSELRITDALGQESTMSFVQTQVNQELSDEVFKISLPEGTDIISDLPMVPE